jgi:hypothetical protein
LQYDEQSVFDGEGRRVGAVGQRLEEGLFRAESGSAVETGEWRGKDGERVLWGLVRGPGQTAGRVRQYVRVNTVLFWL